MGVQKKMVKTPPDKSKKSAVKGVKLAKKASPDMRGNKKVTPPTSGKARGGGLGGSVNSGGGGGGGPSVPPLSTSPSNVFGAEFASVSGVGSDVSRRAGGGGPKKSKKSLPSSPIKAKAAAKKSIEGVAGGSSKGNAAASVGKSVKKGRKSPANPSGSGSNKSLSKTKKGGVSVLVQKKSVKSPSSGGKKTGPTPAKSPKTKSASGTKRKSSPKTSVAKRSSPGKGANKKVATSKKPVASGRKTPVVENEEPSENEDDANESEGEETTTTKRKSSPKKKQGGSGSKRGQAKKKAKPSVSGNPSGKAKSVRNATNHSDHGDSNSSSGDEVSSTEGEEENEPAKPSRKSRVATAPKSKIPTRLTAMSSMKPVKKTGGGNKSNGVADASGSPTSEEEEEEDNDNNGDTDDEEDNVRNRSSQRQTPKKSRVTKVNSKVARTSKKMPVKSRVNDPSSEDQSSSNSEDENSKAKNGKPKGNKNSSQVSAHKMRKFQKRSPPKGKKPVSSSEEEDDSSEDELDKRNQKKGNKGRKKVIAKKTAAKLKSTMKKTKTVSKALMAKKKLKQMQSLGFWGAPPRRAASLNAAAVMHCMYDQDLPSSKGGSMAKNATKLKKNESPMTSKDSKDPKPSKPQPRRSATAKMREAKEGDEDADEDEQDPDQNEEGELSGGQNESDVEKSPKTKKAKKLVKKPPPKSKLALKKQRSVSETDEDGEEEDEEEGEAKAAKNKRQVEKKLKSANSKSKPSTSSKKKPPQLKSLKRSRTSLEQDGSNDENQSSEGSDTDSDAKKETSQSLKHQKKKKTLKDEFKMDIRDMIVKKRIASLNASAIMSASYSQLKSPPLNPIKALALKTDQVKPIVTVPVTQRGSKKLGPKQGEKASKTGKKSAAILTAMSSPTLKKRKISSSSPPDEQQPIIFEIEDERIKSLLIASAMKKAGNNSGLLGKDEKSQKLPPKKRKLEKCALTPISGSGAQKKKLQSGFLKYDESLKGKKRKKKRKKNINVDLSSSSSSSDDDSASDVTSGESDIESKRIEVVDDDDDEIETIFTEGARSEGIVSRIPGAAQAVLPSAENPMALKTEMNKVDVQIMDSGRVIHHHQVVHHRFETISTTTSMVPRSGSRGNQSVQQDDGSTVPENGKYTPLGALASLQPGNGHPASAPSQAGVTPGPPAPAPRFPSTYQGFYQPAGPLIRPGSPNSNVVPPTATVQPTVVSCAASGSGGNHRSSGGHSTSSGSSRDSEFPSSQKNIPSTSPVKPTPHQAPSGVPPATMTTPPYPPTYPYPYPTEYLPTGYVAPPPPPHMPYHPGGAQLPGEPPPPHQAPLHYAPYHPAEFRHPYPLYHHANTAATAQGYPPQGPYYLAPALPYHPSALASTTSPSSSTSGTQVALSAPHPAGTFYYGGYSAAAYPYTAAGRIVTPILALAPPGHQPPPPHSAVPPGFPTQHHQAQTSIYSYSVQHDPKNVQAGSQPVGKGLSSQPPPPPTFATTPTTATTIVVSAGVNTKSVSSANSKKVLKPVSAPSSKDFRPTLKVPTPKSHSAFPSQVVPNEVYRSILPRQPLPPNKGPPGYSKSKSRSSSNRARSPSEVAVVAASKAKVSNVKPCNPPNPSQPFVVGQTTIHPVDPNAIRKPPKPVVAESQMATITPKMVPIVSTVASRMSSSTGKSSLRDYRKPAKSKHQASSSVTSVTQEQASSTLPSGLKYIPPLPVTNQSGGKYGNPPPPTTIYQHLPKGLTITEIDRSRSLSSKLSAKGSKITTVPSNSETLTATTSQVPTSLTSPSASISSPSSCTSLLATPPNNGHRLHLMPVINIPDPHKNRRPPPTSTGHPGLPNGLLRMAHTSLQQQSQPPPPKIATKVVPKDLKSQLALSKIALSMASGSSSQDQSPTTGYQASTPCSTSTSSTSVSKNGQPPPPPSISVSMAKSAAMALHPHQPPVPKLMPKKSKSTMLKAPKVNNNKPSLLPTGARSSSSLKASSRLGTGSPGSSRSSSRNSSLSPRERSGSASKGSSTVPFLGVGGGKSVMSSSSSSSGSSNSSGGCGGGVGSGKVPLSPLSRGQSSMSKKKATINQIQGPLIPWSKRHNGVLKSCNGWQWVGDGTEQKVYLNNEEPPVPRICYDSMKHCTEGDVVKIRDCILLASGNRKKDLPFIAKVTALWENPTDGDMMMSLLWYYRPEHLESGRRSDDMSDEVYASRHRDNTSVACIEDKCYVMTFNEYCRYRKFLRMVDQGLSSGTSIVPDPVPGYERAEFLPTQRVAPDRVFLCRRVYESRQRRLLKNPY